VPDLVPVKKTVTRGGTTFAQTYWVRNQDLRKEVEAGFRDSAVTMAGGDPNLADRMIGGWYSSPGDSRASWLRGAMAKVFNNVAGLDHDIARLREKYSAGDEWESEIRKEISFGENDAKMNATAAAIAKVSQSMYDKETVTLYRGVTDRSGLQRHTGTIHTDTLASFTDKLSVAQDFAYHGGLVLKVEVPVSAIAVSHKAFEASLSGEGEVIIATRGSVHGEVLEPRRESYAGAEVPESGE
jgi:Dinitrogenase reductase ADP-ribosyltransferase (DRAT)